MKDSNALDERVGAGGESRCAACESVCFVYFIAFCSSLEVIIA